MRTEPVRCWPTEKVDKPALGVVRPPALEAWNVVDRVKDRSLL
jgi:hypothetical protein